MENVNWPAESITNNEPGLTISQFRSMTKALRGLQTNAGGTVYEARANLASQLGMQYEGKRDIYQSAGYSKELTFVDYNAYYKRGGIAKRIVQAPPNNTWRNPPKIVDGDLGETEFTRAWESLVNFGQKPGMLNTQKTIWHYLHRADIMAGKGEYGVLVIGIRDGLEMSEPVQPAKYPRPATDLLYLSPYDQGSATIGSVDIDPTSRNFGKPRDYNILLSVDVETEDESGQTTSSVVLPIHYSRVIHIAEELENNEVNGTPRLEGCYNYLEDLLKVTAASGESAWQLMNKGLIASTKDGYDLPDDPDAVKAAMTDFMNELQKVLQLQGMEITIFGGEIVDPTGVIKSIISLISATTGIPQRILLGSEAGELASSMDEINWGNVIGARQQNFAEPVILRPLINTLIYVGLLPQPESGDYQAVWPSVLHVSDPEKAAITAQEASTISSAVGEDKLPIETVLRELLGWSDDRIEGFQADRARETSFFLQDFPTSISP